MLKAINYELIDEEEDITDERYNEIINLFKEYNGKLFRYDNDETIYFEEDKEEAIKSLLKATGFKSKPVKETLTWFDGGQYLKIQFGCEISIRECIKEAQKVIDTPEITNRILNSNDPSKELNKIIKEQTYKVFLNMVNNGFNIINNGNFKWE